VPSRGEIWLVDLDPVRGHEQGRKRPALVMSTDPFNHGPAKLLVVAPITTTDRRIPLHIEVAPPEGGLRETSYVMCDAVRSVSKDRLIRQWGEVEPRTLSLVADGLRILLEL
jgi:mRNA interferase MazF